MRICMGGERSDRSWIWCGLVPAESNVYNRTVCLTFCKRLFRKFLTSRQMSMVKRSTQFGEGEIVLYCFLGLYCVAATYASCPAAASLKCLWVTLHCSIHCCGLDFLSVWPLPNVMIYLAEKCQTAMTMRLMKRMWLKDQNWWVSRHLSVLNTYLNLHALRFLSRL